MNTLKVKKLNAIAVVPSKGSKEAAGYDLCSIEPHVLKPGERKLFKTGLQFAIPTGLYGRIAPRSGLAFKNGIDVMAGVIDSDYRGELGIVVINLGQEDFSVSVGMKIAQIIFEYHNNVNVEITNDLDATDRGVGGFGSTDIPKAETQHTKSLASPMMDRYKESNFNIPAPESNYEKIVRERENQFK